MPAPPLTVVETDRFLADAETLWTVPEREELVLHLAQNPEAGQIIPGTGGVRKMRWSRPGMGKRSGARVIYYFHSTQLPLFLLAAYGKSERANLTQAERNAMKRIVPLIVATYLTLKEWEIPMPRKSNAKEPAAGRPTTMGTPPVGARIVEGLEQALAWSKGEPSAARVKLMRVPDIDIRELRRGMGLSQSEFAHKFGLPPATLRNWEQGRARPDAPTRVLLAVIAKHPDAVADVLDKAS